MVTPSPSAPMTFSTDTLLAPQAAASEDFDSARNIEPAQPKVRWAGSMLTVATAEPADAGKHKTTAASAAARETVA